MKKIYMILIALFVMPALLTNAQNIPNNGFENWNNNTLYNNLLKWKTSNSAAYLRTNLPNAQRKEDNTSGQYAVKLTSRNAGDEVIPGVIALGPDITKLRAEDASLQDLLDIQKYPYSEIPDSIVFNYKADMAADDSARILIMYKSNNSPGPNPVPPYNIGVDTITLASTSSGYQRFAKSPDLASEFPAAPPLQSLDSISIVIASNKLRNPVANAEFYIDDFQFTGTPNATLPNNDFEQWEPVVLNEPNNWQTTNKFHILNNTQSAFESSDVNSGNAAMRLESKPIDVELNDSTFQDTLSVATTANLNLQSFEFFGGVGINFEPSKLMGYYKYTPAKEDSGTIGVVLTKFDNNNNKKDTLGVFSKNVGAQSSYDSFSISFDTLNQKPDTFNVILSASNNNSNYAAVGSQLWIDDLALDTVENADTTTNKEPHEPQIEHAVYPVPAKDKVTFKYELNNGENGALIITDLTGKTLQEQQLTQANGSQKQTSIQVDGWHQGIYLYQIKTKGVTKSGKFVIK